MQERTEIQEIAYQHINWVSSLIMNKWKTLKDVYEYLKPIEAEHMDAHKIYDLAVEIADILFIAEKRA